MLSNEEIEAIVTKLKPKVEIMAHKYYISGGSAEDLLQEGLIGLVDGINHYDWSRGDKNSQSFEKFVLMCAKRQILDAIKNSNSQKNHALNTSLSFTSNKQDLSELFDYSSSANLEDVMIEKIDLQEKKDNILLFLTETEKQVLRLYLEGNKQSEIAKKMNKPVKSIYNSLQKIKSKLRKL